MNKWAMQLKRKGKGGKGRGKGKSGKRLSGIIRLIGYLTAVAEP